MPEMDLSTIRHHLVRTPWVDFARADILMSELEVKSHPQFSAAKSGDAIAAESLIDDVLAIDLMERLRPVLEQPQLRVLPVHAAESLGMNAIPRAFALLLSQRFGVAATSGVIQINRVVHTGADGFHRLAFPAVFDGNIERGDYFLVDDFIGQGGTLANLKGFVESKGARVVGAAVLCGKPYSADLRPNAETLAGLREKHGEELEEWWAATFGYGFDYFTQSEARYLTRLDDVDTIRTRLAAARRARD